VRLGMPPRALRKLVYEAGTYPPEEIFAMGVGDTLEDDPRAAGRRWLDVVTSRPLETFRVVKGLHRKEAWERIAACRRGEGDAAAERDRLVRTLLSSRQPLDG
jgi:hypothetical protein